MANEKLDLESEVDLLLENQELRKDVTNRDGEIKLLSERVTELQSEVSNQQIISDTPKDQRTKVEILSVLADQRASTQLVRNGGNMVNHYVGENLDKIKNVLEVVASDLHDNPKKRKDAIAAIVKSLSNDTVAQVINESNTARDAIFNEMFKRNRTSDVLITYAASLVQEGVHEKKDLQREVQELREKDRIHTINLKAQKEKYLKKIKGSEAKAQKLEDALQTAQGQVHAYSQREHKAYMTRALSILAIIGVIGVGIYSNRNPKEVLVDKPVYIGQAEVMDKYQAEKAAREELEGKVDGLEADNARLIPFKAKHAQEVSARITLKRRVETLEAENKRLVPFEGMYERQRKKREEYGGKASTATQAKEEMEKELAQEKELRTELEAQMEREQQDVKVSYSKWHPLTNTNYDTDSFFQFTACNIGDSDMHFYESTVSIWKTDIRNPPPSKAKQGKVRIVNNADMGPFKVVSGKCSDQERLYMGKHRYLLGGNSPGEYNYIEAVVKGKDTEGNPVSFTLQGFD